MATPRSAERTLDEVRAEVLRRAGKLHPFEGIDVADARRNCAAPTSLDRDHWAGVWTKVGKEYEDKADAAAKAGKSPRETSADYMNAFEYAPPAAIRRFPRPGRKPPTATPCLRS